METLLTLQHVEKVIGLEHTADTHALAKELAAAEEDATLVLACCQDGPSDAPAGEGGVYFTLILKPQRALEETALARALCVAAADTLCKRFGLKTKRSDARGVWVWDARARAYKQIALVRAEEITAGTWLVSGVVCANNPVAKKQQAQWAALKTLTGAPVNKELFLDDLLDNFWKEYAFI